MDISVMLSVPMLDCTESRFFTECAFLTIKMLTL